jgi:hypothetical protein
MDQVVEGLLRIIQEHSEDIEGAGAYQDIEIHVRDNKVSLEITKKIHTTLRVEPLHIA